jgi:hypothetical protein
MRALFKPRQSSGLLRLRATQRGNLRGNLRCNLRCKPHHAPQPRLRP